MGSLHFVTCSVSCTMLSVTGWSRACMHAQIQPQRSAASCADVFASDPCRPSVHRSSHVRRLHRRSIRLIIRGIHESHREKLCVWRALAGELWMVSCTVEAVCSQWKGAEEWCVAHMTRNMRQQVSKACTSLHCTVPCHCHHVF